MATPKEPKTKFEEIWHLLENPKSSCLGWLLWAFSTLWTVAGILVLFLSTVPSMYVLHPHEPPKISGVVNETNNVTIEHDSTGYVADLHPTLKMAEIILVAGFAFGFNLRLVVAPSKLEFIKYPLNQIDMFSFVPVVLGFFFAPPEFLAVFGLGARPLRLIRMIKDLNPIGLRIIIGAIANAQTATIMAVFFVLKMHFAVGIYMAERDEPDSQFETLSSALWFTTVSMTTVGYGDMYPVTRQGKLMTQMTIGMGVLALAQIFAVVSQNYARLAKLHRLAEEKEAKKNLGTEGIELKPTAV